MAYGRCPPTRVVGKASRYARRGLARGREVACISFRRPPRTSPKRAVASVSSRTPEGGVPVWVSKSVSSLPALIRDVQGEIYFATHVRTLVFVHLILHTSIAPHMGSCPPEAAQVTPVSDDLATV
ncbi:hypothetical protein OH76DRAFT_369192 [Lentinus brumalis]|uniref:Uncharacterized protein n=1 Tax=Lentinus brumalis TaxID=2498619 RepID=A0A371DE88_9APHY|nr:hypothetical protein OH76DRAFT_369192 [Polyporus brumalis]